MGSISQTGNMPRSQSRSAQNSTHAPAFVIAYIVTIWKLPSLCAHGLFAEHRGHLRLKSVNPRSARGPGDDA
jgi:hypothetical protein